MNSVTLLIDQVKRGSDTAATELWQRYYAQLVRVAAVRLGTLRDRYVDEEDVVIEAFASMYRRAEAGQFPNLNDRDDLWRLLLRIVECKVINQRKHLGTAKNRLVSERALAGESSRDGMDVLPGDDVSPEVVLALGDELRVLVTQLGDRRLIDVCMAKLEGHTNAEIAERLACSVSSVERKLRMIRGNLQARMQSDQAS